MVILDEFSAIKKGPLLRPPQMHGLSGSVRIFRFLTLCADLCLLLTHQQAAVVYKNSPLEDDTLAIFKLSKEKKNLC